MPNEANLASFKQEYDPNMESNISRIKEKNFNSDKQFEEKALALNSFAHYGLKPKHQKHSPLIYRACHATTLANNNNNNNSNSSYIPFHKVNSAQSFYLDRNTGVKNNESKLQKDVVDDALLKINKRPTAVIRRTSFAEQYHLQQQLNNQKGNLRNLNSANLNINASSLVSNQTSNNNYTKGSLAAAIGNKDNKANENISMNMIGGAAFNYCDSASLLCQRLSQQCQVKAQNQYYAQYIDKINNQPKREGSLKSKEEQNIPDSSAVDEDHVEKSVKFVSDPKILECEEKEDSNEETSTPINTSCTKLSNLDESIPDLNENGNELSQARNGSREILNVSSSRENFRYSIDSNGNLIKPNIKSSSSSSISQRNESTNDLAKIKAKNSSNLAETFTLSLTNEGNKSTNSLNGADVDVELNQSESLRSSENSISNDLAEKKRKTVGDKGEECMLKTNRNDDFHIVFEINDSEMDKSNPDMKSRSTEFSNDMNKVYESGYTNDNTEIKNVEVINKLIQMIKPSPSEQNKCEDLSRNVEEAIENQNQIAPLKPDIINIQRDIMSTSLNADYLVSNLKKTDKTRRRINESFKVYKSPFLNESKNTYLNNVASTNGNYDGPSGCNLKRNSSMPTKTFVRRNNNQLYDVKSKIQQFEKIRAEASLSTYININPTLKTKANYLSTQQLNEPICQAAPAPKLPEDFFPSIKVKELKSIFEGSKD